jgi:heme o synthase
VRQVLARVPDTVRAYVGLTKTRIIEQLLVVTVPAMFLAERGVPPVPLILATLVGGAAAAASAHALNCVIDADIDVKMKRTARRPLAKGQVPPSHALVFGLVLAALSTVWLWLTTNQLAAGLALTAIAFYVLVYTLILKRRTSQNIVWGGAAGCMPVVIGWAAVTGTVGWPALVMFGVIFFWTPPCRCYRWWPPRSRSRVGSWSTRG